VATSCDSDNEPSGSIKCREFSAERLLASGRGIYCMELADLPFSYWHGLTMRPSAMVARVLA
jgi:hypothetical protein